jgi:dihydropteroate synthase
VAFVVYMSLRQHYRVPLPGGAPLSLGERTLIMGVINVTPDSFADGGERFDAARAVADGLAMVRDGADILDVGGESTRPGAEPVPLDEELHRVLPVVEGLAGAGVPLSVDTYKARVAAEAIARGAVLVNDVSGLQYDPELGKVVAQAGAAIVLMHNRGRSKSMYLEAVYDDVTAAVVEELRQAMARAEAAGISREAIILDPGLGFAKRAEHTWASLAGLDRLQALNRPVVSGPSRKSFLTSATGERAPRDRDWATAAAVTASILGGAHIVRVHNVRAMADVVRVADRVVAAAIERGPKRT